VVGAVRRPGLYRLGDGKRVADAVARAGGATRRADLAALNLAAPLVDGTQVLVPGRANVACAGAASGSAIVGSAALGQAATAGPKVSLSTATAEQLDALPGVGPVPRRRSWTIGPSMEGSRRSTTSTRSRDRPDPLDEPARPRNTVRWAPSGLSA
jgi:competence protein ComEA